MRTLTSPLKRTGSLPDFTKEAPLAPDFVAIKDFLTSLGFEQQPDVNIGTQTMSYFTLSYMTVMVTSWQEDPKATGLKSKLLKRVPRSRWTLIRNKHTAGSGWGLDELKTQLSKMPDFQGMEKQAADEDEAVASAPSSEVMDYARRHSAEVQRSEKEVPETFQDLRAIDGEIDPGYFLVPQVFSGTRSEQDGVHLGNQRVFLKRHGDQPGVCPITGDHGAFGVAIRISAITNPMLDDLKAFGEPEDDEAPGSHKDTEQAETHTEQMAEHAQVDEAWADWAHFDFVRALEHNLPDQNEMIDDLDDDQVRLIFDLVRKRLGLEWEEDNTGAFIDVGEVAKGVTTEDLKG